MERPPRFMGLRIGEEYARKIRHQATQVGSQMGKCRGSLLPGQDWRVVGINHPGMLGTCNMESGFVFADRRCSLLEVYQAITDSQVWA